MSLEMCGLVTLAERRENRSMSFAQKCVKHPTNHLMFPPNPSTDTHDVRSREAYMVNKARTEAYRKSTIPDLQLERYQNRDQELKPAVRCAWTGLPSDQSRRSAGPGDEMNPVPVRAAWCLGWPWLVLARTGQAARCRCSGYLASPLGPAL